LPHGASRREVRPERPERRLRLVSAIARGRRWLDEIISGSVTNAEQIALRERCSVRHVNMTISLAFLAPRCRRGSAAARHQHRAAARCSGGMEWAVRGTWVESATIAALQKTVVPPPRSGLRATISRMSPGVSIASNASVGRVINAAAFRGFLPCSGRRCPRRRRQLAYWPGN